MPANLPPQYYELERAYRAEKDPRERLRMAEELLRIMPKHKGTDKLQAEMKAKISKHRKEVEGGGVKAGGGAQKTAAKDYVEREGSAQIILVGPPNAGKSSLMDALTAAKPEIGDYPYTTREPMPGMMAYEAVRFQLIDTPPISPELYEGYMTGLVRNADVVVLVCDCGSESMIEDIRFVIRTLEEKRIVLQPEVAAASADPKFSYKKTIVVAHKMLEDETGAKQKVLGAEFPGFRIVPTSVIDDASLDGFRRAVFEELKIMRVYTKPVGHEADFKDPIILPIGGTVADAALALHKDFLAKLKFAKVWGKGKFDGQKVTNEYVLSDEDIVEFHI